MTNDELSELKDRLHFAATNGFQVARAEAYADMLAEMGATKPEGDLTAADLLAMANSTSPYSRTLAAQAAEDAGVHAILDSIAVNGFEPEAVSKPALVSLDTLPPTIGVGGEVTTAAPTIVTGTLTPLSLETSGYLRVDSTETTSEEPVPTKDPAVRGTGTLAALSITTHGALVTGRLDTNGTSWMGSTLAAPSDSSVLKTEEPKASESEPLPEVEAPKEETPKEETPKDPDLSTT